MNKPIDFQTFWDAYALKRDRIAAERAWHRLSAKDQQAALAGIVAYRDDCQLRGVSRMYAQGYLNHRRWEDEPEPAADSPFSPSSPSRPVRYDSVAIPSSTPTPPLEMEIL